MSRKSMGLEESVPWVRIPPSPPPYSQFSRLARLPVFDDILLHIVLHLVCGTKRRTTGPEQRAYFALSYLNLGHRSGIPLLILKRSGSSS